jgi:hypothetical protein
MNGLDKSLGVGNSVCSCAFNCKQKADLKVGRMRRLGGPVTRHQSDSEGAAQQSMQADPTINDEAVLPKAAEAQIASGLKQLYGQMLAEPMPDRFAGLLQALAQSENKTERKS